MCITVNKYSNFNWNTTFHLFIGSLIVALAAHRLHQLFQQRHELLVLRRLLLLRLVVLLRRSLLLRLHLLLRHRIRCLLVLLLLLLTHTVYLLVLLCPVINGIFSLLTARLLLHLLRVAKVVFQLLTLVGVLLEIEVRGGVRHGHIVVLEHVLGVQLLLLLVLTDDSIHLVLLDIVVLGHLRGLSRLLNLLVLL